MVDSMPSMHRDAVAAVAHLPQRAREEEVRVDGRMMLKLMGVHIMTFAASRQAFGSSSTGIRRTRAAASNYMAHAVSARY